MELDDRTAVSRRPAPSAIFEAFHDRDIVQGAKAAGAEKRSAIAINEPIQPESPHRKRWRNANGRDPIPPSLIRHGALKSQPTHRRRIGRQDECLSINVGAGFQPDPWQLPTCIDPGNTFTSPNLDAKMFEVAP